MAQKTVTRADLAEAVYESVGLSRTESAQLVERLYLAALRRRAPTESRDRALRPGVHTTCPPGHVSVFRLVHRQAPWLQRLTSASSAKYHAHRHASAARRGFRVIDAWR